MFEVFEILFWIFAIAILHSYLFFPIILRTLTKNKKDNQIIYTPTETNLPKVSIVMAAYNEEAVLLQKIESIFDTTYPKDKFEVLIGSDNSSDKTNEILLENAKKYPNLKPTLFTERQGKPKIINQLVEKSNGEILLLTDANVFFTPDTIYQLTKHYKNPQICLTDGLILNTNIKKNGISIQEKAYSNNENVIKHQEGIMWGCMIGAFGGIYSIRKKSYCPVPQNFIVDDFYITMCVLRNGGHAIKEMNAICYEDVSNKIEEEFRRKTRISIGNYQNLAEFWKIIFSSFGIGFCFVSHKILRWLTPFFMIFCLILSAVLCQYKFIYLLALVAQICLLLIPIFDNALKKINLHIIGMRFVTHFYAMNLALLIGFFKYLHGVKSNIWQPTKRNQ